MDEKLINRIISAAYDDCGLIEKRRIKRILRQNPEAEKIYKNFRDVAKGVHALPGMECPGYILDRVESNIKHRGITSRSYLKPAAAFTTMVIAAVVAMFSMINNVEPSYSNAELRAAEVQAKESLSLVSRVLNKTTDTIGKEILPDKVSKPVKEGLNIINNLLIGG
jgi:hypothetical protein